MTLFDSMLSIDKSYSQDLRHAYCVIKTTLYAFTNILEIEGFHQCSPHLLHKYIHLTSIFCKKKIIEFFSSFFSCIFGDMHCFRPHLVQKRPPWTMFYNSSIMQIYWRTPKTPHSRFFPFSHYMCIVSLYIFISLTHIVLLT